MRALVTGATGLMGTALMAHRVVATGERVTVRGRGTPTRDFLCVADAARALRRIGDAGSGAMNLASGQAVSIRAVAELIAEVSGYRDEILWDRTKPDDQRRRADDVSRLRALGIAPGLQLREALSATHAWFAANIGAARR